MPEYSSSFEIESQGARFSVRFPLQIPLVILSGNREFSGTTENISASGVLFRLKNDFRLMRRLSSCWRFPQEEFLVTTLLLFIVLDGSFARMKNVPTVLRPR
ncbi:PilZ domain-containing protein [Alloacidobacterium sp.]|uniref:PilZ domain-containing protein n=1 Tax=Alloacidobacterium sp. TaxID=2951999 RepID=UPI0039C88BB8